MGSPVHVRLLGRFEAARDARFADRVRFSTKKVAAVLAFLTMSPQQAATRELLGTLLWGNSSDPQARQSLRQALLMLRKDLAPADVVDAGAEVVRLKPGSVVADTLQFEALSTSSDLADLERAADLVQGEFLAGFGIEEEAFEDWLRQQRRRFEITGTGVLERYAEKCDLTGKGPQAIATAERLLTLDPLREDWQRLALMIYVRHRGHNEALAQAKAFEETLRRELDVEPEPETQEVIAQIRQAALTRAAPWAVPGATQAQQSALEQPPTSAVAPHRPELSPPGSLAAGDPTPEPGELVRLFEGWCRWAGVRPWNPSRARASLVAAALLPSTLFLVAEKFPWSGPAALVQSPAATSDRWQPPRRGPADEARATAGLEKGLVAIAVLPFTGNSDEAGPSNAMANLITDELTTVLSSIGGIRVISRETAKILRGKIDAIAIGAELGVSYLLEGSASMRGNRLRVNAGLVDTRTGLRVWSHRYERGGEDRHGIQDEIVNSLGRQLQVEVARIEGERPATDPDVHALIAKGWAKLYASGKHGKKALQAAEELFMQALERDADNAQARLGLAMYHVNIAVQLFASDAGAHLTKAEAILLSLIERHPDKAGAHSVMGLMHVAHGRMRKAKAAFEHAIDLNPSHAPSYAQLGRVLVRLGHAEQGLEYVHYAMRLSPRDPGLAIWLAFAGVAELELKGYDKAVAYFDRALALYPGQPKTLLALIATHALLGNTSEANRRLEELQRDVPQLKRETLIQRFANGPQDSRFRQGLRLALGVVSQAPASGERLTSMP